MRQGGAGCLAVAGLRGDPPTPTPGERQLRACGAGGACVRRLLGLEGTEGPWDGLTAQVGLSPQNGSSDLCLG